MQPALKICCICIGDEWRWYEAGLSRSLTTQTSFVSMHSIQDRQICFSPCSRMQVNRWNAIHWQCRNKHAERPNGWCGWESKSQAIEDFHLSYTLKYCGWIVPFRLFAPKRRQAKRQNNATRKDKKTPCKEKKIRTDGKIKVTNGVFLHGVFHLFALKFRLFQWRISSFRMALFHLFAWCFSPFVFSRDVFSFFRLFAWRLFEMAQTSHHTKMHLPWWSGECWTLKKIFLYFFLIMLPALCCRQHKTQCTTKLSYLPYQLGYFLPFSIIDSANKSGFKSGRTQLATAVFTLHN